MRSLSLAFALLIAAAGRAAGQNLLTNGSFEGNLDGWGTWTVASYDSTLDATGTSGSGSVTASAAAASVLNVVAQCVAVSGSTQYTAGGKIYIASGQTTIAYGAFVTGFFSSADCSGTAMDEGGWLADHAGTAGSWVSFKDDFTSPSSARSLNLVVNVRNLNSAGSSAIPVNFDDLYLRTSSSTASYSRWIPAVIHKDVPSKNAKWRSDVAVLNRSGSTASFTFTIHLASGSLSGAFQATGNSQLLLPDVAGLLGVTTDSGPLEVTSDQEFFLSGRTYNQADETHTYGQDYDGQEPSELLAAGDASSSTAWLPQLTENARYRTNIGIANTGTETASVTLTLYGAFGGQMWTDTRDYTPGGFYQYQQPYLTFGGIDSAYAKVTVNSGSGVVAYASVTDQQTNDPTTITMKR